MSLKLVKSLGTGRFTDWGAIDAGGASGGILIFWDNRILELLELERGVYSISGRFRNVEDDFIWVFTGVYGLVISRAKEEFWEELGAIKGLWDEPWSVGGDFNSIRFPGERRYGHNLTAGMRRFSEVIEELNLKDLPSPGGQFTWFGGLNSQAASRLDRFLINNEWEDHFLGVFQSTLPKIASNRCPILLEGKGIKKARLPSTSRICGFCRMGSKSWFAHGGQVTWLQDLPITVLLKN